MKIMYTPGSLVTVAKKKWNHLSLSTNSRGENKNDVDFLYVISNVLGTKMLTKNGI